MRRVGTAFQEGLGEELRLLAVLLLVGCAIPARYGVGVDHVNQRNSSTGSTEFVDGSNHSAANSWDFDQEPYQVLRVWLEWDNAPEYRDMSWLSDYREKREFDTLPPPPPPESQTWWQKQVESILAFDADKLLIIALLIFVFKKDIVRLLPSWLKKKKEEE